MAKSTKFLYGSVNPLHFIQESNVVIEAENANIQKQINKLCPSFFNLNEFKIQVNHKLILIMINSKIRNVFVRLSLFMFRLLFTPNHNTIRALYMVGNMVIMRMIRKVE